MKLDRKNIKQLERHAKELERLGALDGVESYMTLCRIEKRAHKLAEDMCNFDVPEEIQDKRAEAIIKQVEKVFGGKTPMGFFINYDPRGYALKIKEKQNRIFVNSEDGENHDERVISFTDWGGFGILAPDFE